MAAASRRNAWRHGIALLLAVAGTVPLAARPQGAGDFRRLAPGVFVLDAATLVASAPPGEAGNVGLLTGRDAAVLVDTGASSHQGRQILAAAHRVSSVPLRFALITHALPEFLFGAGALQDAGVPVLAQRDTADLIAQRCKVCLQRLRDTYGEAAMAGSRVPVPDRTMHGDADVDLGDRKVRLIDFGWAGTPGDVAVLDPASGTLFAGGLVVIGRIPNIRDAHLEAWLAALDRIAAMPLARIVPGHGPVVTPAGIAPMRDYLRQLDARVRSLYAAQASLSEALDQAQLPAFSNWPGYAETHRQNVQTRYLALEKAELERAAR